MTHGKSEVKFIIMSNLLQFAGELALGSKCPPDQFWDGSIFMCRDCTKCSEGEKLISPCQEVKDASCEKCLEGTYLNAVNKSLCVQCSYCGEGEVVLIKCKSGNDTQCGKIPVCPLPSERPQASTQQPSIPTMSSSSHRTFTSQKVDEESKVPECKETRSQLNHPALLVTLGLLLLISLICNCVWFKEKIGKWRGKDTPVPDRTVDRTAPKESVTGMSGTAVIEENNIKFSTIPANITEELAQYLNIDSGNNYIYLAGKMKYDSTFTNNLKLLPREATQELLKDWQMRDDATVYKLYCYLEELERHDCMAILRPLLISQGSDVAMV